MIEREPFIPYADPAGATPGMREMVERYQARMGWLPNALKFYLHRPAIAELLFRLNDAVMRDPSSTLDRELKRKCGALASKLNGCKYCTTHHCEILASPVGFAAEGWELEPAELDALLDGSPRPANAFEQTCFDFVAAASLDPSGVPEALYERLAAELTPPQIVELAAVVGFWKMYNTIHDCLRVPIEQQLLDRSATVGIP